MHQTQKQIEIIQEEQTISATEIGSVTKGMFVTSAAFSSSQNDGEQRILLVIKFVLFVHYCNSYT